MVKEKLKKNDVLHLIGKVINHRKDTKYIRRLLNIDVSGDAFFLGNSSLNSKHGQTYLLFEIMNDKIAGFFAIYRQMLSAMLLADYLGFVPKINIVNTIYNDNMEFGKETNLFDLFFDYTDNISLDEVCNNYNYFYAEGRHLWMVENKFIKREHKYANGYLVNDEYLDELSRVSEKYLVIREDIRKDIYSEITALLQGERTLGVHFRGTDFKSRLEEHPKYLTIDQYYPYIERVLEKGSYNMIFLATDELEVIKKFEAKYGNKVIYYQDVFRSDDGRAVHKRGEDCKYSGYRMAREVLRDMLTLASCDALISGLSQVSICARIQKRVQHEKYEYLNVINDGLYSERK